MKILILKIDTCHNCQNLLISRDSKFECEFDKENIKQFSKIDPIPDWCQLPDEDNIEEILRKSNADL